MQVTVKICGLSTPEAVATAVEYGAKFLGYIHYPASPRHVSLDSAASLFHKRAHNVLVCVDPDDALLGKIDSIKPDYIQLHGSETPERIAEIKACVDIPLIK
jgi:phosphoribosylanthranilate isomerase